MPVAIFFARNLASICRNFLRDEKAPKGLLKRGRTGGGFLGDLLGGSFMETRFREVKWPRMVVSYGKSRHQASTALRIVGQLAYNDFEPRINGLSA